LELGAALGGDALELLLDFDAFTDAEIAQLMQDSEGADIVLGQDEFGALSSWSRLWGRFDAASASSTAATNGWALGQDKDDGRGSVSRHCASARRCPNGPNAVQA
jgi:hypothetical protein